MRQRRIFPRSYGDLISFKAQDAAYGCDWKKWARFANSLKLKIAARLYNNEPAKAMQLVEEAASNKAGLMTSTDDDFLFCKATVKSSGSDDYVYGTGNGILSPSASRSVMNFMLGAKDPRVRFIYTKNSFNSSVVQAFIDKGRYDDLPSEVKANVIRDKDGNFEKWGGMGEPWVRYTSVPIVLDAKASHAAGKLSDEMYEEYFNPGLRYEIKLDDDHKKDYSPFSYYSTEMRKGRDDFQLPTAMTQSANGKIDMNVLQDTEDNPLYSMYMTAGEVNLYLAEFACLKGSAIAGKTYQEWYYAGVRASVEEYDKLAKSNKIPYYYDEGNPGIYAYDKFEKTIALQKGEIDTMLATDNIKLTGTKSADLEKIYIQLMMHFGERKFVGRKGDFVERCKQKHGTVDILWRIHKVHEGYVGAFGQTQQVGAKKIELQGNFGMGGFANGGMYNGSSDYNRDSNGRNLDVWKMKNANTYYFEKDGKQYAISRLKSLYKKFPKQKAQLEAFASEHGLDFMSADKAVMLIDYLLSL